LVELLQYIETIYKNLLMVKEEILTLVNGHHSVIMKTIKK